MLTFSPIVASPMYDKCGTLLPAPRAEALPNLRIASDKDVPVNANCCRHIDGDTVPAQMIEFPPLKQASGQRKLPPVIHTRHLPRPTSNITMTMPAILHCH